MKNEKACSGEGTAQTMPKAGAAQAAAKTGAGRTGHVPDCPCRHKNTPRSTELQADMQKRLNRAIGQLNGVKAMIEDNRYCMDIMMQLQAVESLVHKAQREVLRGHLSGCVQDAFETGDQNEREQTIAEIIKLLDKA